MTDFTFISVLLNTYPLLLSGMWITVKITFISIFVGIILGTTLAIMRLFMPKPFSWFAALYVNTFRSIPLLMVLMWFYLILGPNLQVWIEGLRDLINPEILKFLGLDGEIEYRLLLAIIAFSLFESAYYSEIIRAGIMSVKSGQNSAALALGMTRAQTLRYVILPQAFRNMIPLLLTQCIILFQDTSLVYIISLTDFFRATDIIGYNNDYKTEFIIFAGFIYFVICFTVSSGVRYIQSRNKI